MIPKIWKNNQSERRSSTKRRVVTLTRVQPSLICRAINGTRGDLVTSFPAILAYPVEWPVLYETL